MLFSNVCDALQDIKHSTYSPLYSYVAVGVVLPVLVHAGQR